VVVRTERRGHVAVVTIDRPEARNAVNGEVARGIEAALDATEHDDDVRAVVITGAGDRAFCAGADLKAVAASGGLDLMTERGGFGGIVRRRFPKVLLAAVNGAALAGGFEIVLACDLVVAAEHATFGIPEAKRGLIAAAGGLVRLPHRVSLAIALELGLTGDPIDAARAYQLGLVNRVVPASRVLEETLALAEVIAANAPVSVRESKALLHDVAFLDEAAAWRRNDEAAAAVTSTEDLLEGVLAFAEKRPPVWKGR
jgi:enoyl-CoA hydratase/carnithine racemase